MKLFKEWSNSDFALGSRDEPGFGGVRMSIYHLQWSIRQLELLQAQIREIHGTMGLGEHVSECAVLRRAASGSKTVALKLFILGRRR